MSSVKIVFRDLVTGSKASKDVQSVIGQLLENPVLNIGGVNLRIESVNETGHLTDPSFKRKVVLNGRVMDEQPE